MIPAVRNWSLFSKIIIISKVISKKRKKIFSPKNWIFKITHSEKNYMSQKCVETQDLNETICHSFGIFQKSQIFREIFEFQFFGFWLKNYNFQSFPIINGPKSRVRFSHFSLPHLLPMRYIKKNVGFGIFRS